MNKFIILFVQLAFSIPSFAGSTEMSPYKLVFTENKGQIIDQYLQPNNNVDFKLGTDNGLSIYVGKGKISYQFYTFENMAYEKQNSFTMNNEAAISNMYRMDVELVGANINPEVVKEGKSTFCQNFYTIGLDKDITAYNYEKVTYRNIYPDIDWVLYTDNNQLKHEFVVRKGGNVNDIKLKYSGHTALKIDDEGSIIANTPLGEIRELAPVSFIDGHKINSRYNLNGDIITYAIDNYSGILVIDPAINWSTYFGASTGFYEMQTDSAGNYVYLCGFTNSAANVATTGSHQVSIGGSTDAFLTKFNTLGFPVWGTYFGGSNVDYADDILLNYDRFSNQPSIYLCGYTRSTNNIATPNTHKGQLTGPTNFDGFLAKFNDSGKLVWSTYYGGTEDDRAYCLSVDTSGRINIAGYTYSASDIATLGAHQSKLSGDADGYIAQFNDTGKLVWATYYGGDTFDHVVAIGCEDNSIYVAGYTGSIDSIATLSAHQLIKGGGEFDGFLAKFNSSGVREWGTYYGGENNDRILSIAIDETGSIFTCGVTSSKQYIASPNSQQTQNNSNYNKSFLSKFDKRGLLSWARYYGASDSDELRRIYIGDKKNIYAIGATSSETGLIKPGAIQSTYGGGIWDGLLVKFDTAGNELWNTYFGGPDFDVIYDASFVNNEIFIAGYTRSQTQIATSGSYKTSIGGITDGFIASICDNPPVLSSISGGNDVCIQATMQLLNSKNNGIWQVSQGNASVNTTGLVTGIMAGIDTVWYTVSNYCGSDSVSHPIDIQPLPVISLQPVDYAITSGYNAQFTINSATSGVTYQWQVDIGSGFQDISDGGLYNGSNTNTLTITGATVTNDNQQVRCVIGTPYCNVGSSTAKLSVWPVSVTENHIKAFSIRPNPASDRIGISAVELIERVDIYNLMGQIVLSENTGDKDVELNISTIYPGVYFIKVNGSYAGKLIKK